MPALYLVLVAILAYRTYRWLTVMGGQRATVNERGTMPEAVGL